MELDFELRPGEDLPQSAFERLRDAGPVVWSESLKGWLVSSYDAVRTTLSDVSRFTSQGTPVAEVFGTEGMLVNDTPFHHTIRAVWARHVGVAAMEARLQEFIGYARVTLREARPRLEAGETIDLVPVFRDFVLKVVSGSFGLPSDRFDVLLRWSEASADTPALELEEGSPEHERHFTARANVFALIDEQVADRERRLAEGEDPGDLLAMMVAAQGSNGVTASVARDNIFNFMLGAFDTSEKWFGNIVCRLYGDRALFAEVDADRSLAGKLIDEVMRFDSVAQTIQRRVREDGIELCGQSMKKGDALFVLLGAANRDPEAFEEPDRFDIHRNAASHLGFGFGFHHCLGLNIARAEAIALVNALLEELPDLKVENADFGTSWALWGPRELLVSLHQAS